ncbi:MAG: hypothetical protein WA869_17385, partial [Alloacidobacterium sp.]
GGMVCAGRKTEKNRKKKARSAGRILIAILMPRNKSTLERCVAVCDLFNLCVWRTFAFFDSDECTNGLALVQQHIDAAAREANR